MLSDRCPDLSVCPVCNVGDCGQTVRWNKMKHGTQVGLGPNHTVLDGNPAPPPPKGHSPQFSAHICCGQMAGWIKMSLGMEVGLGPGDFVLDGDPAAPSEKGGGEPQQPLPTFRPCLAIVAKPSPSQQLLSSCTNGSPKLMSHNNSPAFKELLLRT